MRRTWISIVVSGVLAVGMAMLAAPMPAMAATCNSTKTGNWNDTSVWSCDAVPGASDDVYVESGHTVTLTQDESVNNLHLNTSSGSRLNTGSFTLSVNGKTRAFTGPAPGTNGLPSSSTTWINTSGGGKIRLVGTSRIVFNTSEWSANPPGWRLEIALNSGETASAATNVKAGEITVTSGTFSVSGDLRPDGGSSGTGTLTISSGATLMVSGPIARTGTANDAFATFTNNGTLNTSNSSSDVWPSTTTCSFAANSTVEYSRSGAQIIQTPSGSSYGSLTLSGSGTKTAPASLEIRGSFTVASGVTFSAGTGTVTFNGSTTQNLTLNTATTFNNLTVNSGTMLVETVSTDNATVNGTLTNSGTIRKSQTVSATGSKTFGLAGRFNGADLTVNVTTQGSLSNLQVDRVDSNHPSAGTPQETGRYWTITPDNSGYTVNITLPRNNSGSPTVCRYTGIGTTWSCAASSQTSSTVTRNDVTTLSDWAVGDDAPTAVTLGNFTAYSAVRKGLSTTTAIAMLSFMGLAGVWLRRRR